MACYAQGYFWWTTTTNATTTTTNTCGAIMLHKFADKGLFFFLVFKQPLALHSTQPLTGFTRTGYCEVPASDAGNHSIAGIVSKEFLDFSASRGNDLRQIGLKDGCKWCLCVSRWKEAFDARTGHDDKKVPKVVLKATNEKALARVTLEDLKGFAVDKE
ncbi:hypothetical protein A1F97_10349 [Pyrenophora tritici-repentis]|uniref:Uncharacterized protein n=1 Tax=Pyrenophora tritici-repentis TaxID=45151 RepID=A0A2W1EQW2_9PLEO|nr:hypothetical protein Ptr86124_010086 [Pyrenophora tritici-repentis]KAI1668298.1 hypothetical protein L13192_07434 [Pyrenophora tritici-repentis]KAI1680974.1 hypothetical protein KJE20_09825 [Pyrenophora tritici-repentis]PWO20277.1 UhpC, Sugar phosphate permease [Pyrenophora tritici-repentis]PZC92689.1 hypothetical protein A1F95_07854 [Pyrenophora tritici-repentis]